MQNRRYAFWSQFVFMFAFTKVVKLMGLFIRNPSDILFLPVSVVFGYFHGLIKLYALITLNMTLISGPYSHSAFTLTCTRLRPSRGAVQ